MPGRSKDPAERARKRQAAIDAGLMRGAPDVVSPTREAGFGAGNDAALSHGAYVPAMVNPLAERKLEWYLGPDWPEHVKVPYLRPTLWDLAVTETQIEMLDRRIVDQGIDDANAEFTTTVERVTGSMESGDFKRTAESRKTTATLETRRRLATHRLNLLKELGLTPMARAKLGKDVSSTAVNMASIFTESEDD